VIRFLPMIMLGTVITVVGSLSQSHHIYPKQPSGTPRTSDKLCREVAHELNIQAHEGMILPIKARQIIDRCHALYTEKTNE